MTIPELLEHFATTIKTTSLPDAAIGTLLTDRVACVSPFGREWKLLDTVDEVFSIRQPEPDSDVGAAELKYVRPCYRFVTSEPAIATGDAYVRFASAEPAMSHQNDIADAGFEIQRIPEQTPNAAWVTPLSKQPADGIRKFSELTNISGLTHAELQLLRKQVLRSRGGVGAPPPPTS